MSYEHKSCHVHTHKHTHIEHAYVRIYIAFFGARIGGKAGASSYSQTLSKILAFRKATPPTPIFPTSSSCTSVLTLEDIREAKVQQGLRSLQAASLFACVFVVCTRFSHLHSCTHIRIVCMPVSRATFSQVGANIFQLSDVIREAFHFHKSEQTFFSCQPIKFDLDGSHIVSVHKSEHTVSSCQFSVYVSIFVSVVSQLKCL